MTARPHRPCRTRSLATSGVIAAVAMAVGCKQPPSYQLQSGNGGAAQFGEGGASATTSASAGGGGAGGQGTTGTGSTSTTATGQGGAGGGWGTGGSSGTGGTGGAMPVSVFCGDGIRGLDEECDDGPGSAVDACSETCQVSDFAFAPSIDAVLQFGRHPVAAGADDLAVAFVDRSVTPPLPYLAVFGPTGQPAATPFALDTVAPAGPCSPVVAPLPDGAFAVAWTNWMADGDERGISLQRIDPALAVQAPPVQVNVQTEFNQYDPDILWTGSELVVAWVDDTDPNGSGDIFYRTFDTALQPLGVPPDDAPKPLADGAEAEARVALAPFNGSWAAAWRAASAGFEYVTVASGMIQWEVGPLLGADPMDQPALVELDADHLLVVFSEGDDVDPSTSILSGAVLDVAQQGLVGSFSMAPPGATTGQSQPAALRVGSRWFVTWRSGAAAADPNAEELWIREISWDGTDLSLSADVLPLPRWPSDQLDDQRGPAVAASPLGPEGAVWAAWEDWNVGLGHPTVVAELIPVPILRTP